MHQLRMLQFQFEVEGDSTRHSTTVEIANSTDHDLPGRRWTAMKLCRWVMAKWSVSQ